MNPIAGFLDALMTIFPMIAAVVLILTALVLAGAVLLGAILIAWDWLVDMLEPVFETVQDLVGRHIRR